MVSDPLRMTLHGVCTDLEKVQPYPTPESLLRGQRAAWWPNLCTETYQKTEYTAEQGRRL